MSKLRVMSLFSGIGAFEAALRNIGVDYELIGFSEIDKYAIKSYCAIHNVDEQCNFGDVSKIDKKTLPDFDLLVGGSPCQSFSVAGHRKGFEDTRGTLFFQYIETLKEKQPKLFVFENVKGLINHDKGNTLNIMTEAFSEVGYRIDLNLLNSKFFNVPQNRERLYIIGIREDLIKNEDWSLDVKRKDILQKGKQRLADLDIKSFNFRWPVQSAATKRLKDLLEEYVDEKYYLNEDKTNSLIKELSTNRPNENLTVEQVGNINPSGNGMNGNVYNSTGLSPTITTNKGEGLKIAVEYSRKSGLGRELAISHTLSASDWRGLNRNQKQNAVVEVRPVLTPERGEKRQNGRRFKDDGEPAFTVNTIDKHGVAIGEYPKYQIRRLTPLECFRLQAFDDEDFEKAFAAGISNSQLYKQAGNSITVTVLESIFKELIHTYNNKESE
ncbi:DNA cytosine methyltransferase [Bacillus atrophaeus]|uniref:DNA cytosine methyltransferase n=1 Tax=Bacillus atrophaeus TaxID=1452 RepID=UPI002280DA31|nr:DNA cytosine methyltransferase [Bacillus atrophaeus]MCY8958254.1 DNA cytosine methyltransferase [Bacillus atrophaeus]MCY8963827.1 DNA cytosine methyltransferase [Bacillus atrophaeus]MCY9161116.1 DNA cytosine methyltransferase [Bacillus atrophaeus]MCY9440153.1 DNA cytosine methyltransferase [Bacillus atrophaeus]MEC0648433.1 DNA cytosine methyltransferase [Bacillus atrophaeus]